MASGEHGFGTTAVHAGTRPEPVTGAIMTPIFQTSTYVQEYPGKHKGYEYSRTQNPTREALEECIAGLEGGAHGVCFGSGLAAADTTLKLLSAGDEVIAGNDLYGGTYRLFTKVWQRFGLTFKFVDTSDLAAVRAAITPKTRMLWVETPSNPLLKVSDLAALGSIANKHGLISLCDNTFATPYLQRPLTHGFSLVLHSTTKYLGGHSDVVGGCVVTSDAKLHKELRFLQNACGAVPGPFDCFLTLRGCKTLHVRMDRHCSNAAAVAAYLAKHPKVKHVLYPGLPTHEGYEVAKRQMRAFGGMVSFELIASVETAMKVCASCKVFACAESLGGVESLIEHPASMTHASVPVETRRAAGFADGLIRLSVGIEDERDLIDDLARALALA